MNIQDRDKPKLNGRQRQVKLQPKDFQMTLGNAVPKHKITINNKLDDLFPKVDLNSDEENENTDNDFLTSLANDLLKMTEAKAANEELVPDQEEEKVLKREIRRHILTKIINDWKRSFQNTKKMPILQDYIDPMKEFVKFLVIKKVADPTARDAKEFLEHIFITKEFEDQQIYISAMDEFFRWTDECGKYKNIVRGLKIIKVDGDTNKDLRQVIDNTELLESQKRLKDALHAWIISLEGEDVTTKTRYKSVILELILFFNSKNVKNPTFGDILRGNKHCSTTKNASIKTDELEIICKFFHWAYKNKYYTENIIPKSYDSLQQNIEGQSNDAIFIHSMIKFGFNQIDALSLLNNELTTFKNWLNSNPQNIESTDVIFQFAHFLYEGTKVVTTPTQRTIIDYYVKYLSVLKENIVNRHIVAIKHFFRWTAEQKIYPNITANIVQIRPGRKQYDNLPILGQKSGIKLIPRASKPLITNIK